MALTGTETYGEVKAGFVTDEDGLISTTNAGTGFSNGFLRDDDGRLAVTTVDDGTEFGTVIPGFLTDADGRLVITGDTTGAVDGTVVPGFWTNASGALIVSSAGTNDFAGRKFPTTSSGYLNINKNYAVALQNIGSLGYLVSLGATEGLTDLSGNGITSTNTGSLTIGGEATGPLATGDDGATTFPNTTGKYILTDYIPWTAGQDLTFMAWLYRDSATGADTIIADTDNDYGIRATGAGTHIASFNATNNASLTYGTTGEWYHLAVAFDANTSITWYINGANPEVDASAFDWTLDKAMKIGEGGAGLAFHGDMAWVSVHEKKLTDAEVAAAYAAGT